MSQVEAWQLVNVRPSFLDSKHGKIGCTGCHGGDATATEMEKAHAAMVAAPSDGENPVCGTCHGDIAAEHNGSMHKTMNFTSTLIAIAGIWLARNSRACS